MCDSNDQIISAGKDDYNNDLNGFPTSLIVLTWCAVLEAR